MSNQIDLINININNLDGGSVTADNGKVIDYKVLITEKNHYKIHYNDSFL